MEKVRWTYGESPTQVFYTADTGPDKICVFRVRWFKKWMAVVNNRLLLDPSWDEDNWELPVEMTSWEEAYLHCFDGALCADTADAMMKNAVVALEELIAQTR